MGKKLLLVDDSLGYLNALKARLEADGHEVLAAGNPELAKEVAKENRKSLDGVITDLDMLGDDGAGLKLMRDLRRLNINCPILLMSGTGEGLDTIEARVKASGGNGFLHKSQGTFVERAQALDAWIEALAKPTVPIR